MNILPSFIIFSAYRTERDSATNAHLDAVTMVTLSNYGYAFKRVEGYYKGAGEASLLVVINSLKEHEFITSLARELSQESILMVDHERHAKLLYLDSGEQVSLGKFRNVSKDTALTKESYTHDNGCYYIAGE